MSNSNKQISCLKADTISGKERRSSMNESRKVLRASKMVVNAFEIQYSNRSIFLFRNYPIHKAAMRNGYFEMRPALKLHSGVPDSSIYLSRSVAVIAHSHHLQEISDDTIMDSEEGRDSDILPSCHLSPPVALSSSRHLSDQFFQLDAKASIDDDVKYHSQFYYNITYDANSLSTGKRTFGTSLGTSTSMHPQTRPCALCSQPQPLYTCTNWQKHMEDHECKYICTRSSILKYGTAGQRCGFCGTFGPEGVHLDEHKSPSCNQNDPQKMHIRYASKAEFTTHLLQDHNASPTWLADSFRDRWRHGETRNFFSCGFCINLCSTYNELLAHISLNHDRRAQDSISWDCNKVIQGLLLQRGVSEAFRELLSTQELPVERLNLGWHQSENRELQMRLEMGTERPDILARAALAVLKLAP